MQGKKEAHFHQFIRQFNQNVFFDLLSSYEGSIAIVWDGKAMTTQFDLIVSPKLLAEHNVTKNYKLEHPGHSDGRQQSQDTKHVIYLLYPTHLSVTNLVRNWLQKLPDDDLRLHHVFFVPDATFTLKQQLREDQRVWNRIQSVHSLPFYWNPTEHPKLITMDLLPLAAQMVINGDWNYLFRCANAIRQLEQKTNRTLSIRCKGEWSARIADMLRKLRVDSAAEESVKTGSEQQLQDVSDVVIVDRWVDPMTPMLRQFTFGGVCDEFLSIDSRGVLKVPLAEFEEKEPEEAQQKPAFKEIKLNNRQIYEQLQDLHVNSVAAKIRELVDELKEEEQQREKLASLAEYKNFVSKLPNIVEKRTSTGQFTRLTAVIQRHLVDDFFMDILHCEQEILRNPQPDKVIPFIESAIIGTKDKVAIIRLIILQSLYSKGLKISVMQSYIKLIVQSYGISELRWILKLQLAGLLRTDPAESKLEIHYPIANFAQLASRKYKENFADVDELKRFGSTCGTSLLVRFIEEGLRSSWSEFATIADDENGQQLLLRDKAKEGRRTIVFVVGGMTRSEVAMLNQIDQQQNLLYCTTSLLGANDLLNSFRE